MGTIEHLAFTNDIFIQENKHYATLFVTAQYLSGQARIMESDKCEGWDWFVWNEFPESLFLSLKNLLNQGVSPFTVDV